MLVHLSYCCSAAMLIAGSTVWLKQSSHTTDTWSVNYVLRWCLLIYYRNCITYVYYLNSKTFTVQNYLLVDISKQRMYLLRFRHFTFKYASTEWFCCLHGTSPSYKHIPGLVFQRGYWESLMQPFKQELNPEWLNTTVFTVPCCS